MHQRKKITNPANAITFFRLLGVLFLIVFYQNWSTHPDMVTTGIVIVFLADGLDGYLARKLACTSQFGAFFDIFTDRLTELLFFFLFYFLGDIPLWIAIFFLLRGLVLDIPRLRYRKDYTHPFDNRSKYNHLLVKHRLSRASYALAKMAAVVSLHIYHQHHGELSDTLPWHIIFFLTLAMLIGFLRCIPTLQAFVFTRQ